MNEDTRGKLASARALAAEILTGTPARSPELELLEAFRKVRRLPMHGDVEFVIDIAIRFFELKTKGGGR